MVVEAPPPPLPPPLPSWIVARASSWGLFNIASTFCVLIARGPYMALMDLLLTMEVRRSNSSSLSIDAAPPDAPPLPAVPAVRVLRFAPTTLILPLLLR